MNLPISKELAHSLFLEAYYWSSGRAKYLAEDSRIRTMAKEKYNNDYIMALQFVCNEVFYTLACESMGLPV